MSEPGRLRLLQAVAAGAFVLLALQLVRLQLIDSARNADTGSSEHLRTTDIEPPRGLIYDRNGILVASNVPRFFVSLVPGELPPDAAALRSALRAVERHTELPYGELEQLVARGLDAVDPLAPVPVLDVPDFERAIELRAAIGGLPGVRVEAAPVRDYAGGTLLAHMLGYVGPIVAGEVDTYLADGYPLNAHVGRSGLELTYERELRGVAGRRLAIADPTGRELELIGALEATPGADLVLAIDLDLQRAVAAAVDDGIARGLAARLPDATDVERPPAAAGAAVVIDVRSGELLALVSLPSFEASVFAGPPSVEALEALLTDRARPLIDRSYMEVGSPGSIFKPLVAAAALQERVARPDTRITSTGAITVQDEFNPEVRYVFRDWAAHGTLDLYGGIVRSSDVYFYYLSGGYRQGGRQLFEGLGAERVAAYASAAGLGAPTGIDLPGEAAGLVPTPAWKAETLGTSWVLGDTYTFGIGQGYLTVTPLQMAVAVAAIANDGEVLVPRIVRELRRDGLSTPAERQVSGRLPVDAEHLAVVREAMRRAANPGGTAVRGEPPGVSIGGKTGTAEFGLRRADGEFDTHAWYLGFAPFERPEIAIAVYLEHGVGATHAGPVARAIFEAYFGSQPVVRR